MVVLRSLTEPGDAVELAIVAVSEFSPMWLKVSTTYAALPRGDKHC